MKSIIQPSRSLSKVELGDSLKIQQLRHEKLTVTEQCSPTTMTSRQSVSKSSSGSDLYVTLGITAGQGNGDMQVQIGPAILLDDVDGPSPTGPGHGFHGLNTPSLIGDVVDSNGNSNKIDIHPSARRSMSLSLSTTTSIEGNVRKTH